MKQVERMRLGVVVERRRSDHPWQDHGWRPVAVLPGAAEVAAWRLVAEGPGWQHYHAGTLALELFPKETEAYRINLTAAQPSVYVILRWRETGDGREVEPFHLTASAEEVQDYLDAGNDVIEAVPMPPVVRRWVEDYVAGHHQPERFEKRERKGWKDVAAGAGRSRPLRAGGRGAGGKP